MSHRVQNKNVLSYRTLRPTSCNSIWLRDEFTKAPTNWVSKFICHAHGSRTTRGWVARIWFFNASIQKSVESFQIQDSKSCLFKKRFNLCNKTICQLYFLLLILANVSSLAVWVNYALWSTSSDGIWFWNEALIAPEIVKIWVSIECNEGKTISSSKQNILEHFLTYKWHYQKDRPYNEHQDHMVKDHKGLVFQRIVGSRKHIRIHSRDLLHILVYNQ